MTAPTPTEQPPGNVTPPAPPTPAPDEPTATQAPVEDPANQP